MIYEIDLTTYNETCKGKNVIVKDDDKEKSTSIFFVLKGNLEDDTYLFRDKRILSIDFTLQTLDEVSIYCDKPYDVPVNLHYYINSDFDYNALKDLPLNKCRLVLHLPANAVMDIDLLTFCRQHKNLYLIGGDVVFLKGVQYGSLHGIRTAPALTNNGDDTTFYGNNYKVITGAEFISTTPRTATATTKTSITKNATPRKLSFFKAAFATNSTEF